MRVAVLGAGGIGCFVAHELSREGHDVVLVDRDPDALREAEERADVLTLHGDVTHRAVLRRAGVSDASLVVAATGIDPTNIVAASLASSLGAKRSAARVDDPGFFESPAGVEQGVLGVQQILCASRLVADELVRLVARLDTQYTGYFAGNAVQVSSVSVTGCLRALGRAPSDLDAGPSVAVTAVVRDGALRAASTVERLEDDDALVLSGAPQSVLRSLAVLRGGEHHKRAIVVGGGDVGSQVARRLTLFCGRVMLIERDRHRSEELAHDLEEVTIVCGDGTSLATLQDEHAEAADVALSTARADEVNLMSALMLRDLGVRDVFALVHRSGYADAYAHLGLCGAAGTHDALLQVIRRGMPGAGILGRESLTGSRHDLMELLLPGQLPSNLRVADLALPAQSEFVALARKGQAIPWRPDTPLAKRDTIVVAAPPHTARQLERAIQRLGG